MCSYRTTRTHPLASMQRDPVVSKASELLRLNLMPSPSELRQGKVCPNPPCVLVYPNVTLGPFVSGHPDYRREAQSCMKILTFATLNLGAIPISL